MGGPHSHPTAHLVRTYAAQGMTDAMIGAKFDLLEDEFTALLKKDKAVHRAYRLGRVDADTAVHQRLWDNQDKGLLLLQARMRLKMEDPVLDALAGDMLKTVLSKMDTQTKNTLSKALGLLKK